MNREQFNLKSIKLLGTGGVEATYVTKTENATGMDTRTMTVVDSVVPAPDLKHPFEWDGVDFLTAVIGFPTLCSKAKLAEAKALLSCHKFTIGQKGDNLTIIATGKLSTGGTKIAINSPLTMAEKNGYGVDMSSAINKLEDEAFAYFFEGKKAQLDINEAVGA